MTEGEPINGNDHELTAAYLYGRADANEIIRKQQQEIERLRAENDKLRQACRLYRDASLQGHSSHWDPQRTGGLNCPECIRADKLRTQADSMVAEAAGVDS